MIRSHLTCAMQSSSCGSLQLKGTSKLSTLMEPHNRDTCESQQRRAGLRVHSIIISLLFNVEHNQCLDYFSYRLIIFSVLKFSSRIVKKKVTFLLLEEL